MKKICSILAVVLFTFFGGTSFAQTNLKLGHINAQELLTLMPERKAAQAEIEKYAKSLKEQIDAMQTELNKKYQDYTKNEKSYTEIVKQSKQKELQSLQQRIQEFNASAQKELQNKEKELITPILDKAKNAIQAVAKEKGFTYILDASVGVLLYQSNDSKDILPLVKKKLNIN